jgi:hypothetical protein
MRGGHFTPFIGTIFEQILAKEQVFQFASSALYKEEGEVNKYIFCVKEYLL